MFECLAYIHIQDIYRLKLDLILNKCTFFGYERTTKSYRIWNPSTHWIVISRDVTFNENSILIISKSTDVEEDQKVYNTFWMEIDITKSLWEDIKITNFSIDKVKRSKE